MEPEDHNNYSEPEVRQPSPVHRTYVEVRWSNEANKYVIEHTEIIQSLSGRVTKSINRIFLSSHETFRLKDELNSQLP